MCLLEPGNSRLQLAQLALQPLACRNLDGKRGLDSSHGRIRLLRQIVEDEELQPQDGALDERDCRPDHGLR
jgi:hypothetical protein